MRFAAPTGFALSTALALALASLAAPQAARADGCLIYDGTNYSAASLNATDNGLTVANGTTPLTPTNIVCGQGASITGTDATTLGSATTAGQGGTALGANAAATGTNSVALGQGSTDGGAANVVSVGSGSLQRRITNVAAGTALTDAVNLSQLLTAVSAGNPYLAFQATGAAASAAGTNATAIGVGAVASAPNSVALGTGSVANQANTVSVGAAGSERRVVNVAPGTVSATSTDAVNGSQLYAVQQSTATLSGQVSTLTGQIDLNQRQANGGIAAAMAMGGTVIPADANGAISFNLATFRGEQGFSGVLVQRLAPKVYVNVGVAGSSVKGSTGARAGVTIGW